MSWLRRLSRDRSSKAEPEIQAFDQPNSPQSHQINNQAFATKDSQFAGDNMRRSAPSQQYQDEKFSDLPGSSPGGFEPAPDPLTRAFNEALGPYIKRLNLLEGDLEEANNSIALLKNDLDNANQQLSQLQTERAAFHNWIDKRGLRPDLPPELARSVANSPVGASTLASQLDRKMTMINFSLHHLADSLPNPIPASTVTDTLSTLLPKISFLSSLPTGSEYAFESLIKLAGNLNSHNSGEETEEDKEKIAKFYSDLDDTMQLVVRQRSNAVIEGELQWDVQKDVRRLEKTSAFLRKEMGVRNYFLRSLDTMKGNSQTLPPGEKSQPFSTEKSQLYSDSA